MPTATMPSPDERPSGQTQDQRSKIQEIYRRRQREAEAQRQEADTRMERIGNLRLIVGVVLLSTLFVPNRDTLVFVAFATAGLCFAFLVIAHTRLRRRSARHRAMAELNGQAIARMERDWSGLPDPPQSPEQPNRLLTDLDILGTGSLSHLLGTLATPLAWRRFFEDVLQWDDSRARMERQGAVAALGALLDHRQRLYLAADALRGDGVVEDQLIAWATACDESPGVLPKWMVIGLTVFLWLTIISATVADVPIVFVGGALAVSLLINLVYLPRIHQALEALERSGTVLRRYAKLLEVARDDRSNEPYLQRLLALFDGKVPATTEIARLQRLVHLADLRHGGLPYLVIQVLTLWNFHVYFRLAAWRRCVGARVPIWIEGLAEYELLATLAGLYHDNPDWCFPTMHEGHTEIRARGLGHPLIADGVRVPNDLDLGGGHKPLLFVTGSNMSGKSTLLRALGINIVLAWLGGPVCARGLSLPPVALATCFNIKDALVYGRSLFMAELLCIRAALDMLEAGQGTPGHQPVFLFDEILRGTNSGDRRIAVAAILRQLIRADAIGAIATHDLQLADERFLLEHAQLVHFQEHIEVLDGTSTVRFDYRLREGLATTSNALLLLQAVGIDTERAADE